MKRLMLLLAGLSFATMGITQNVTHEHIKVKVLDAPTNYVEDYQLPTDRVTPDAPQSFVKNTNPSSRGAGLIGEVIGHTTYDLQSNSSDPQRLFHDGNGNISATWTGSINLNSGSGWPDRGTFYNHYNGSTWKAEPTIRLEAQRTGWPTNVITKSGAEVSIAHNPQTGNYFMVQMDRPAQGTGSWTETTNFAPGIWPRAAVGGANGETIHLIDANYSGAGNGDNLFTRYYRSTDAGQTWNTTMIYLPGLDSAGGYNIMGGDAYAIAARGDTIAILAGNSNNDVAIWKSEDNGASWTRTSCLTNPIPNMDGTQITDINSDGVADTLEMHDAAHSVLIDDNGMVHVWVGRMRIIDDDPGNTTWSYFPGTNGLLYWNETFGVDSMQVIAAAFDIDNSGVLDVGVNIPVYNGVGLSSWPSAAIDENLGRIFMVYSAVVENTDFFNDPLNPDAQSFRDLYGMYTNDYGQTWTEPVNLTRAAKGWYENAWPTTARVADGKVHVLWQRDQEPGHSLEAVPDPVASNEMVYMAFEYSDFDPKAPIADWNHTVILGTTIQFNDSSEFADLWDWTFGDGFISSVQEPLHTYSSGGMYNVCQIASNNFGADTFCKTITVVGIEENNIVDVISLYPNPSDGILFMDIDITIPVDLKVSILNIFGMEVLSFSQNDLSGRKLFEFDLTDQPNGIYILKIQNENLVVTQKFNLAR